MTKWRAWYTDGRIFDSRRYAWRELPLDGVLVVVVYYDEDLSGRQNRKQLEFEGWYFHEPGTDLFGATSNELDGELERYPGAVFKRGKWTDQKSFEQARQEAWESEPP